MELQGEERRRHTVTSTRGGDESVLIAPIVNL